MATSSPLQVHYAAFTHSGKCYKQNQDALLLVDCVQQKAGFWQGQQRIDQARRFAIADGVGGLPNAAAASRRLLQELLDLDHSQPQLTPRQRLIPLHFRLVQACRKQRSLLNAGATLVTAEIADTGKISLWHAGDSRGYHFTPSGMRRLTEDHTLAYSLALKGKIGRSTFGRALDNLFIYAPEAEEPYIGLQMLTLQAGELLLLVSDGVTLHLNDTALAACFVANDPAATARQIYEAVMAAGAEDNLSAVVLQIQ